MDQAKYIFSKIKKKTKCILFQADVTNWNDVKRLYAKTMKEFGKIDILINNAGTCDDNLLLMMTNKQWENVINLNLSGVFYCCKIFSKKMIKQNYGKIINIASLKGQIGSEGQTNYSASKAGVIGFTKALAKELGQFNISVNAVCPGFIITDMNKDNTNKIEHAKKMSVMDITDNIDELLSFLVYISSDYFKLVSGRVFNIDSRIL